MNYNELAEDIMKAMEKGDYARAQTLAQLLIGERLDRLCQILSAREKRW